MWSRTDRQITAEVGYGNNRRERSKAQGAALTMLPTRTQLIRRRHVPMSTTKIVEKYVLGSTNLMTDTGQETTHLL